MVKQKSKSLLCTDLIRIAVFNKDAIDFYNMKCMLRFQVVGKFSNSNFFFRSLITEQMFCILYSIGQHVTFYLTTYYTMLCMLWWKLDMLMCSCRLNRFLQPRYARFSSYLMRFGIIVLCQLKIPLVIKSIIIGCPEAVYNRNTSKNTLTGLCRPEPHSLAK